MTLDRRPDATPWHELATYHRDALLKRLEEIERGEYIDVQQRDENSAEEDCDCIVNIDDEIYCFGLITAFPRDALHADCWLGLTPAGRAVLDAAALTATTPASQPRTTSIASRL